MYVHSAAMPSQSLTIFVCELNKFKQLCTVLYMYVDGQINKRASAMRYMWIGCVCTVTYGVFIFELDIITYAQNKLSS